MRNIIHWHTVNYIVLEQNVTEATSGLETNQKKNPLFQSEGHLQSPSWVLRRLHIENCIKL